MPIYLNDGAPTPSAELGEAKRVQVKINDPANLGLLGTGDETLEEPYQFIFYTHAEPVYASVEYIQLKGGEIIEQLPEAALYLMSYAQSTLINDTLLFAPAPEGRSATFYNRARTEFAACRTCADLLRAIISAKGTSIGRKALADFSVDTSAMGNLLNQARNYLSEFTNCYKYWQSVLYSGGAADHDNPFPQSAVKAGYSGDIAGIGRGWIVGAESLPYREDAAIAGDTYTRPRRYGVRYFGAYSSSTFHHYDDHLQRIAATGE